MRLTFAQSKTSFRTYCNELGFNIEGNPTNNCQLFSIGSACDILISLSDENHLEEKIKDVKEAFKSASMSSGGKKLCLIDIEQYYIPFVKKVFSSKEILVEAPYVSSNSSEMCIMVLYINKGIY